MLQHNELLQQEIIRKTDINLLPQSSFQLFREQLADHIHQLINKDFNKLILVLYRVDISEKKLKEQLANNASDAGLLIADLIIARESEKIKSRQQYSHPAEDIPGIDKW